MNQPSSSSPAFPFAIGCPVWNSDGWADVVFPARTPRRDWLHWYTRMFNTVEGNSTFYALPSREIAQRWADEAASGFHFALKFPRDLSHEGPLHAGSLLQQFIDVLNILDGQQHAGPAFLQLPPWFDASRLEELTQFLRRLPTHLSWAVEVRHESWFGDTAAASDLNAMLHSLGIDRVNFDSRALFDTSRTAVSSSSSLDATEREAQRKKPNPPVEFVQTASRPMLRLVGRNDPTLADTVLQQWLPVISRWVQQGLRPYVFAHAPDDRYAPALARRIAAAWADLTQLRCMVTHRSLNCRRQPSNWICFDGLR